MNYQIRGVGKVMSYIFTGTGIIAIGLIILLHYTITNERKVKILAREEARKLYNTPKYRKKEESL